MADSWPIRQLPIITRRFSSQPYKPLELLTTFVFFFCSGLVVHRSDPSSFGNCAQVAITQPITTTLTQSSTLTQSASTSTTTTTQSASTSTVVTTKTTTQPASTSILTCQFWIFCPRDLNQLSDSNIFLQRLHLLQRVSPPQLSLQLLHRRNLPQQIPGQAS